jgi:hypothetical protein
VYGDVTFETGLSVIGSFTGIRGDDARPGSSESSTAKRNGIFQSGNILSNDTLDSFIQEASTVIRQNLSVSRSKRIPHVTKAESQLQNDRKPEAHKTATAVPTIMPPPCHRSTARNDNPDEPPPSPSLPLHAVLSSLRPLSELYDVPHAPQSPLRLRNPEQEDLHRTRLVYILNEALRITASFNELWTMDGPDDEPTERRHNGRQ